MKNSQKITRIHLSVNDQDIPVIIGLVSHDPDYKLSLKLNRKLDISLKNIDPVLFQDEEGKIFQFSKFSGSSLAQNSGFQLVSNRAGKNFLLKRLINIDYLLLIQDPEKNLKQESIISQIREIESITGVFNIDIKTLKDKNLKYLI
jgi:hypothetical protein